MRLIKYLLLFLLLLPFGHAGPAQEFTEPTTFTLRLADPFALLFAYHRLDLSGNVSRIQVDLDGDGELDWLITADGIWRDRQGSLWSVFLRDGDEFITPISSLGRGALTFHERSFFVGDWDGNGRIELVARYHVSGAISHLAAYRITPRGIEERTIDPKWYREDHPEWDEKFKNFKDQLTVESIPIGTLLDKYPAHGYLDKQAFDDGKAHSRECQQRCTGDDCGLAADAIDPSGGEWRHHELRNGERGEDERHAGIGQAQITLVHRQRRNDGAEHECVDGDRRHGEQEDPRAIGVGGCGH